MSRLGRNDPCSCGSGKKFKKCCEGQLIKGKFRASHISLPENQPAGIMKLTSLFHSRMSFPSVVSQNSQESLDLSVELKTEV